MASSIKILVVGGSNSVLKGGYVDQCVGLLNDSGVQYEIANSSIGANTCMRGLSTLKSMDISSFSHIVIEYFINDYALTKYFGSESWLSVYEGIIRYIRGNYPQIEIIPIVLGRRDDRFQVIQRRMRKYFPDLEKRYAIRFIDFDTLMRKNVQDPKDFRSLYRDGSHYRTLASGYVAALLTTRLLAPKAQTLSGEMLPQPISSLPLEGAVSRSIFEFLPDSSERTVFQNSKFSAEAYAIEEGSEVSISLPGRLLSINYVASALSGDLLIGGISPGACMINTLHQEVANGNYGFLLRSVTVLFEGWANGGSETNLTLSATRRALVAPEDVNFFPEYHMIENTGDAAQRVYVTDLTYA